MPAWFKKCPFWVTGERKPPAREGRDFTEKGNGRGSEAAYTRNPECPGSEPRQKFQPSALSQPCPCVPRSAHVLSITTRQSLPRSSAQTTRSLANAAPRKRWLVCLPCPWTKTTTGLPRAQAFRKRALAIHQEPGLVAPARFGRLEPAVGCRVSASNFSLVLLLLQQARPRAGRARPERLS